MLRERPVRPQAWCALVGVALALFAGGAPFVAAAPARMVPVAASDAKPPVPPRPAAAASSPYMGDPPSLTLPHCEGLVGEVRQACIERTAVPAGSTMSFDSEGIPA